ncbi:MAG: hypothetical protein Q9214_003593 [Letrouitia sp. 1 TL-2023]
MASIKANARKVVCIGRNYADHIKELNSARPKRPFFFLKPPSSILPPASGPVLRPRGVNLHHEVELALVIGEELRDLDARDEERAMDAIDGYVLSIDMTARNVQDDAKDKGLPWSIAKGFDTFLPISNYISKSRIRDPHNVELWLSVNDRIRQNASTQLMLFSIPRQLADISQSMTLEKGDLVLTGTPSGVGSVGEGDVMKAGLRSGGKELMEGMIEAQVAEKGGLYEYQQA